MKNILFFGDSLTAGYGLANVSLESLPALLQEKINNAQLEFKITNAGLSGDTSAGGLQRIDLLLYKHVDVFVLELGANDILRGVPPQNTIDNLQSIINKVRTSYPEVKMLLLGMEIPSWIPGALAAISRSLFRKLATENKMELVPFLLDGVAGMPHLNLKDGFHPSAEGYKVIADKVWPELERILITL